MRSLFLVALPSCCTLLASSVWASLFVKLPTHLPALEGWHKTISFCPSLWVRLHKALILLAALLWLLSQLRSPPRRAVSRREPPRQQAEQEGWSSTSAAAPCSPACLHRPFLPAHHPLFAHVHQLCTSLVCCLAVVFMQVHLDRFGSCLQFTDTTRTEAQDGLLSYIIHFFRMLPNVPSVIWNEDLNATKHHNHFVLFWWGFQMCVLFQKNLTLQKKMLWCLSWKWWLTLEAMKISWTY